ncbi:hypothetical protein Smic_67370 [Streptomyces microflavus]|uniref:Uncharacterized protein n=1 Tax=Streptomyces microflavus TaxID=1919 RepID=A0A7J0D0B3_STRMI|nr:hypothetical protein Smic_67370 [Streptomyces microflavus]
MDVAARLLDTDPAARPFGTVHGDGVLAVGPVHVPHDVPGDEGDGAYLGARGVGAGAAGAGAAPAVPAKGTSVEPRSAAEVARRRALRPGRADLARPGTEEGEEVMQLIYR